MKPGCLPAGAGCAVVLAGAVFFGFSISSVFGVADSIPQVKVPGSADLTLAPATYTVYLEHQTVYQGKAYSSSGSASNWTLTVTDKESGEPLELRAATMSETYSFGSRRGRSVWTFTVARPGVYTIAGTGTGEAIFAVGSGVVLRMMSGIALPIGALMFSLAVAAALWIVALLRYLSARKAAPAPPEGRS